VVTVASGLGRAVLKNKSTEGESSVSVVLTNSSSDVSGTKRWGDGFIVSVLEQGEELTPLEMILNIEIIISLLILVHMSILIFILLHKLYISSS
jgi:hypothetical protein